MHILELRVMKLTVDEPLHIADPQEIMALAGFDPRLPLDSIAMTGECNGIVLDGCGNYRQLPDGYYVTYREVPVPLDE
jgi:hypothetical protein